jgi:hypothetical protein
MLSKKKVSKKAKPAKARPRTARAPRRAGYSGKALHQKLGLETGDRLYLIGAPEEYFRWLELAEGNLESVSRPTVPEPFVHLFLYASASLEPEMAKALALLGAQSVLWVSWRKGKKDGIGDQEIRNWGLAHGLVDVKVAAVSEEWSALKFLKRKAA